MTSLSQYLGELFPEVVVLALVVGFTSTIHVEIYNDEKNSNNCQNRRGSDWSWGFGRTSTEWQLGCWGRLCKQIQILLFSQLLYTEGRVSTVIPGLYMYTELSRSLLPNSGNRCVHKCGGSVIRGPSQQRRRVPRPTETGDVICKENGKC